jgi:hypothetical protein
MIEVPISECCEYNTKVLISRSKYKLPKIGEGIFQYLIKSVMNIEASKRFTEVTPERYVNMLKLKHRKDETYYWIQNEYIYTTNPDLKALRVRLYIEDDIPAEIANPDCEECRDKKIEVDCTNPYDKDFKIPGFLEKDVVDMTSQKLLGVYHKIQTDHTQDNLDSQVNKV